MVGGKQGHAPCNTSSSKNPQDHENHLLWAPNSPKVGVGSTSLPLKGRCKFSLQYDGRPDERFGLWVGTLNLRSLSGKGEEVCEELRKWMIDVRCLQEVRWRGQGARILGMNGRRYTLWCSGKGDGVVGVIVKEDLCEKVVEVRRISDRVMTLVVVFGRGCAEVDLWVCSTKWKMF